MTQTADQTDKALFDALWAALVQQPFSALSLDRLAADAGLAAGTVYIRYADTASVLLAALRVLDEAALAGAAADFADAPEASVQEKLLEGLISRFEVYTPYRAQMAMVHDAARRDPLLAACLLARLSDTIDRLLSLCGDHVTGWRRTARIKGVAAVVLRARSVWQKDDKAGLALTLRALDKDLTRAAEWAVSLRVLSAADLHATEDEDEFHDRAKTPDHI